MHVQQQYYWGGSFKYSTVREAFLREAARLARIELILREGCVLVDAAGGGANFAAFSAQPDGGEALSFIVEAVQGHASLAPGGGHRLVSYLDVFHADWVPRRCRDAADDGIECRQGVGSNHVSVH